MTNLMTDEEVMHHFYNCERGTFAHKGIRNIRAGIPQGMVFILHSKTCKDSGRDLRLCPFSLALDKGVTKYDGRPWDYNKAYLLGIDNSGLLMALEGTG